MIKILLILTLCARSDDCINDSSKNENVFKMVVTIQKECAVVLPKNHYQQVWAVLIMFGQSIDFIVEYESVVLQYFVPFGITFFT